MTSQVRRGLPPEGQRHRRPSRPCDLSPVGLGSTTAVAAMGGLGGQGVCRALGWLVFVEIGHGSKLQRPGSWGISRAISRGASDFASFFAYGPGDGGADAVRPTRRALLRPHLLRRSDRTCSCVFDFSVYYRGLIPGVAPGDHWPDATDREEATRVVVAGAWRRGSGRYRCC
jgi:hypothetical protein